MTRATTHWLAGACAACSLLCGAPARAQAPAAIPAGPDAAASVDAQKADAKAHFDKALALFEDEAWDAALVEFQQSRALFPTRAATKNAAICLRKLHRFDEAIDLFEELLRAFPNLPADERALALAQTKELASYVGTLVVQGAEPGSKIVIDGRDRGQTPMPPLRVPAGTHVLRVTHEGFMPFEQQFSVTGARSTSVAANLAPLLQGGRLHVEEASGRIVDVVIDGALVGKTPWEGLLPVGEHVITLQADDGSGTQPSVASVRLNASTQLRLRSEALPASLRISPEPAGATLILDGVPVGRGAWRGRLRSGYHLLETQADGFVSDRRRLATPAERETAVTIALQPAMAPSGHVFIEVDGGFAFAPSLGGALVQGCEAPCATSSATGFELMGHGGYQLGTGLALLLDVGILSLKQRIEQRGVSLYPQGLDANLGEASDALSLSGVRVGPSAEYRRGDAVTLTGRLGVGVFLGWVKDDRVGSASTNERDDGNSDRHYPARRYAFDVTESPQARYLYVAPEFRVGWRLAQRLELSAGVRALLLVGLSEPRWHDENPVFPGDSYNVGPLRFGSDILAGRALLVVSPSLGARLDF
ncbi:MAG: PEGA domain-containing protein [Myxococcales bacterium]